MESYKNSSELISKIKENHRKFDQEFDNIPEALKDFKVGEVDRSPREILSYQLGWIRLLLKWEEMEQAGIKVVTPHPDYKWNNLGGLYASFYEEYKAYSLREQRALLNESLEDLYDFINSLTEDELFESNMRNWSSNKAQWPIWKWIHINSVAPFKNFRTKIRRWKKLSLNKDD